MRVAFVKSISQNYNNFNYSIDYTSYSNNDIHSKASDIPQVDSNPIHHTTVRGNLAPIRTLQLVNIQNKMIRINVGYDGENSGLTREPQQQECKKTGVHS